MPPHIQPRSLQDLCVKRAALMVYDTCLSVHTRCLRDNVVQGAQAYFLSHVRPLYDRVCIAVNRLHLSHRIENGIFLSMVMHDRIRALNLWHRCFDGLSEEMVTSMVREKLTNLVELEAREARLTDNMLEAICHTCKKLEKITITCDPRYCKQLSWLGNLLECRELRYIEIEFVEWESKWQTPVPYIAMLIAKLPTLETLREGFFINMSTILLKLDSVTQLREVDIGFVNAQELAKIVRVCPHVRNMIISVGFTQEEERDVLTVLAESSLQLKTLEVALLKCSRELMHMLELKGAPITKLKLVECEGWVPTVEDMCAIASNCPLLEELSFSEATHVIKRAISESSTGTHMLPRSPVFRRLTLLALEAGRAWNSSVLLHVIRHADRLASLTAVNVFAPGRADLLSEILDANALPRLESLCLDKDEGYVSPHVSRLSLERLVQSCPKLSFLDIQVPLLRNAQHYIHQLEMRVKRENLDLYIAVSYFYEESSDDTDDYDEHYSPGTYATSDESIDF